MPNWKQFTDRKAPDCAPPAPPVLPRAPPRIPQAQSGVKPGTPRTNALCRLKVAVAAGKSSNVKGAVAAAKLARVPLYDILKAVKSVREPPPQQSVPDSTTVKSDGGSDSEGQPACEPSCETPVAEQTVQDEDAASSSSEKCEEAAAEEEVQKPSVSQGFCVECGTATTSRINLVWCCVPCAPFWENALKAEREEEEEEEQEAAANTPEAADAKRRARRPPLHFTWEERWNQLATSEGSCVECGRTTAALIGGVRCCPPCCDAWEASLKAGWTSNLPCDGWSAAAYAHWAGELHGLSKAGARHWVMDKFPDIFAAKGELVDRLAEVPDIEASFGEPLPKHTVNSSTTAPSQAEPEPQKEAPDQPPQATFDATESKSQKEPPDVPPQVRVEPGAEDPVEAEPSRKELMKMSVSKLRALLKSRGLPAHDCIEKKDFVDRLRPRAEGQEGDEAAATPTTAAAAAGGDAPSDVPEHSKFTREELLMMPVSRLKAWMRASGISSHGCIDKLDCVERLCPQEEARPVEPDESQSAQAARPSMADKLGLRKRGRRGVIAGPPPALPPPPPKQPTDIMVRLTTDAKGHSGWAKELNVPSNTLVGGLKRILARPEYDLPISHRTGFRTPGSSVPIASTDKVFGEMVLVNFIPGQVRVRVRTDVPELSRWAHEISVPVTTTIAELRRSLRAAPHCFSVGVEVAVWTRPFHLATFNPALESSLVEAEVLLRGFIPPEARATNQSAQEPVAEEAKEAPQAKQAKQAPPPAPQSVAEEEEQGEQAKLEELQRAHGRQGPRLRRAYSWGRTLAFLHMELHMRRGSVEQPLVVWILAASEGVEVWLAEAGFFDEVNSLDWAPTEIVLWGEGLRELSRGKAQEGYPPRILTASYAEMASRRPPDLMAVFMAEGLPDAVLRAMPQGVRVAVTTRFKPELKKQPLFGPKPCPFSAGTGGTFEDNGWLLVLSSADALGGVLKLEPPVEPSPQKLKEKDRPVALFWGICDLKYNPALPVLERVQLLETGDGRTSKFSHDGAEIPKRFRERYRIKSGGALQKYTVVSTDKRLTHDLMEAAGYGHIVPKQVCFPRRYEPRLGREIVERLEIREGDENDIVVLKLCNRSRGAGVLVVPADELNYTLADILVPPEDMEAWLGDGLQRLTVSVKDLGLESALEEQLRHWWGNEGPCFVAERYCTSMPTLRDGQAFDGTMRVSFVLRLKRGRATEDAWYPPEDLEVEWLGGYWKLPKADLGSSHLRDRSVSAAKTGTASVQPAHLQEVYAALGDSMQRLFGGEEPSQEWLASQCGHQPELEAYLIARLGVSWLKDPERARAKIGLAQEVAQKAVEKRCIGSFLSRCRGVCEVKPGGHGAEREQWVLSRSHFRQAVELMPWNANALFWLGMAELELENLSAAEDCMSRSLLLDPDFKGPYVNLAVVYLRLGKFQQAIDISFACLARFPQSPQCHYHVGVAAYQLALARGATCGDLLEQSREALQKARESEDAQKRSPARTSRVDSPWLDEDDRMLAEAEALTGSRSPAPREVVLPPRVGWRFLNWRV